MAIRWRKDGTLICAAMSEPQPDDTYIDDKLSYKLRVELQVILDDKDHDKNGLCYWINEGDLTVKKGVTVRTFGVKI